MRSRRRMAWSSTAIGTLTWSGTQPAWRTRASLVMNTTRWSTGRLQIMHLMRWWTIVEEAMIVIRPACSSIRATPRPAGTRSLPGFPGSGAGDRAGSRGHGPQVGGGGDPLLGDPVGDLGGRRPFGPGPPEDQAQCLGHALHRDVEPVGRVAQLAGADDRVRGGRVDHVVGRVQDPALQQPHAVGGAGELVVGPPGDDPAAQPGDGVLVEHPADGV